MRDSVKDSIIELGKEQWQGYILPIGYTTETYYDVAVKKERMDFLLRLKRKHFRNLSSIRRRNTIIRTGCLQNGGRMPGHGEF